MSWESYALGPTRGRRGYKPYRANLLLLAALTLVAGLLLFIAAHLVNLSEKLASIEVQLRTVDSQLRRVDALAAVSMSPRDQRIKESQSPEVDLSRIESRLSLLQSAIGGFGPGDSLRARLDELKSQLAYCRRL